MTTQNRLTRQQVLRMRQEGRLSAEEATELLNQVETERRAEAQRPQGALDTLSSLFNPLDPRNTRDFGPVTVKTPLAELGLGLTTAGVAGGGGAAVRALPGAIRNAPSAARSLSTVFRQSPAQTLGDVVSGLRGTRVGASLGTGRIRQLQRGAAVVGGTGLAARPIATAGQETPSALPSAAELSALRPEGSVPIGGAVEEQARGIAREPVGGGPQTGGGEFPTQEITLSDGTRVRMFNVPGVGWITEEQLRQQAQPDPGRDVPFAQTREGIEFQAALESAQQGRERGQRRTERFLEGRQRSVEATRAFERERELAEFAAEQAAERQRQALTANLLGQLFGIASSPGQRLRFLASQARGGGALGQVAEAGGLGGGEFENLLQTAGLGGGQTFNVEDRLARMFGLQPGMALNFAQQGQLSETGIIPTLGQVSDLSQQEQEELDAITDVFGGRRLGEVQRQARRLAPPGGSSLSLRVR